MEWLMMASSVFSFLDPQTLSCQVLVPLLSQLQANLMTIHSSTSLSVPLRVTCTFGEKQPMFKYKHLRCRHANHPLWLHYDTPVRPYWAKRVFWVMEYKMLQLPALTSPEWPPQNHSSGRAQASSFWIGSKRWREGVEASSRPTTTNLFAVSSKTQTVQLSG